MIILLPTAHIMLVLIQIEFCEFRSPALCTKPLYDPSFTLCWKKDGSKSSSNNPRSSAKCGVTKPNLDILTKKGCMLRMMFGPYSSSCSVHFFPVLEPTPFILISFARSLD